MEYQRTGISGSTGFNILVFHDYYPEGDQGGIEFIIMVNALLLMVFH